MKRIQLTIIIAAISIASFAQKNIKLGAGYFGNTLTYPGLVLEFEYERTFSEKASLPLRVDIGFYHHPRYHTGVFAEVNYGFRRYFNSGLFLEESIGLGVLQPILSSDGVFEVDDNGQVQDGSRFNKPDLMPSISLGIGYSINQGDNGNTLVWLRPKLFWQYPHKRNSTFTPALQVGFTRKIK